MEILILFGLSMRFVCYITSISNNDSLDWKWISADAIQKRVLSKVCPGSIILFHNAALHTPEALPGIIQSLQKDGYKLVPVSQLIYHGAYTIDTQGKQHTSEAASGSSASGSSTASNASAQSGA